VLGIQLANFRYSLKKKNYRSFLGQIQGKASFLVEFHGAD
jgi:hypothetical protein